VVLWPVDAQEKGWVVRELPTEAWPGAIGIKIKDTDAGLFFVKKVYAWGVVADIIGKDGMPVSVRLSYEQINDSVSGYTFRGYIWPVRMADYLANRQKYNDESAKFLHSRYKGFSDAWWGTWMLREFDKYAPAPGVNWHGSMVNWLVSAKQAGWQVSSKPNDAQVGALIFGGDPIMDRAWGGIVRKVANGTISFENITGIHTISIAKLPQYNFTGYILPKRLDKF
jgi:hypothetical protein